MTVSVVGVVVTVVSLDTFCRAQNFTPAPFEAYDRMRLELGVPDVIIADGREPQPLTRVSGTIMEAAT